MINKIGKSNSIIKKIKKYQKKNTEDNIIVIEDLFILSLLKKYNHEVIYFLYCDDLKYKEETVKIIKDLKSIAQENYLIAYSTYQNIVNKKNSIGLLAVVKLNLKLLDEINPDKYKNILVTDKLELPGNLGTIYRTAEATNIDLIINVDLITSLSNPKTVVSSRGMILAVSTVNTTFENAQKFLLENNYTIYLGEPELGENCFNKKFSSKSAIVIGSERFGINKKWYMETHEKIFIPMYGEMKSLNVGVAASILMYQLKNKQ